MFAMSLLAWVFELNLPMEEWRLPEPRLEKGTTQRSAFSRLHLDMIFLMNENTELLVSLLRPVV